jgi:hypothetical protein
LERDGDEQVVQFCQTSLDGHPPDGSLGHPPAPAVKI